MKFCTACGQELDTGRFCTSCGTPVDSPAEPGDAVAGKAPDTEHDDRTDTAERPAVRATLPPPTSPPATPPAPPPATTPPTTAPPSHRSDDYSGRYPLFADQPPEAPPTSGRLYATGNQTSETEVLPWMPEPRRGRKVWPVFAAVGVVLAVIVGLGIWLLGSGNDEPTSTTPTGSSTDTASGNPSKSREPSSSPDPEVVAPKNPKDLARTATATAPMTAPPNEDVRGNLVRYTATNMLDGVASTAWRMPGDGTNRTLTFTLPSESVLTEVGLINGYAKIDRRGTGPEVNWYNRNRRITEVEWIFDDGTRVTQSLDMTRQMQTVAIPPVATTTIKLRLLSVSTPGVRDGRNYTPISDVRLVGG